MIFFVLLPNYDCVPLVYWTIHSSKVIYDDDKQKIEIKGEKN